MAEVLSLLRGLDEFLEIFGCSSILIELDSLELVKYCNDMIEVWNRYVAILAECFVKAG
jgi:hypothetical protein